MASLSGEASSRRSSCSTVTVVPSILLDANLHEKAAEITQGRYQEQQASFSDGSHDDDLMTPPDVLLKKALKQSRQLILEVGVASEQEVGVAVDCCIRCTGLARMVHGDSHWILAKTHIQLARAYLELRGLPQQALSHAKKGCSILLAPDGSHDPSFEVTCQLALAYCITGQGHTMQGDLAKGEQELMKAKRTLSKALSLGSGKLSSEQAEVERMFHTALARLYLKKEDYSQSRDCFTKSIELTKSSFGPSTSKLVAMLRGLATAEAHLSLYGAAEQTLQDALEIAEANHGENSTLAGEIAQAEGRLGALQLKTGLLTDPKPIEEKFSKAFSAFNSQCGLQSVGKALHCKEEWAVMLMSLPDHRERAVAMLKELLVAKKGLNGELSAEVAHTLKLLGTTLLALGEVCQARHYLHQAREAYHCSLGAHHKDTIALSRSLQTISESSVPNPIKMPRFKTVV